MCVGKDWDVVVKGIGIFDRKLFKLWVLVFFSGYKLVDYFVIVCCRYTYIYKIFKCDSEDFFGGGEY